MATSGTRTIGNAQISSLLRRNTYLWWDAWLNGASWGQVLPNTSVEREAGYADITIKLYGTPILVFGPEGHIRLNSGGYKTRLTIARMSALLPAGYEVYQEKHAWWVGTPFGTTVRFFDNMTLDAEGNLLNPPAGVFSQKARQAAQKDKGRVRT